MANGILTKGVELYNSTAAAASPGSTIASHWTWATDPLKSMFTYPDLGGSRDSIDVTCFQHDSYVYIPGIKDLGDKLTFEFIYEGNASTDNFAKVKALADDNIHGFYLQFPNSGSKFYFEGYANVIIQGAGVNEAIKFTLEITISSDFEIV